MVNKETKKSIRLLVIELKDLIIDIILDFLGLSQLSRLVKVFKILKLLYKIIKNIKS